MDYLVPTHNIILRSCGCHGKPSINLSKYYNDLGNAFYLYREESFVLADMVAQFETCADVEHAYKYLGLRKDLIYDMFCVLNKDCLDERTSPLTKRNGSVFNKNMFLFYESDEDLDNTFEPRDFSVEEIAPHLETLLDRKIPLIFMALNFLDVPLGYVCFHYNNYSMSNYYKIPQTVNALNSCIGGLGNIRYQKYLTQQIEDMYKFDNLTGLYNRNGFIKEFNRLINIISSNGGGKLTAILVDLDGLKYINDNFGHGEGDTAIYTVAQAVKSACPEDAICARFGGDEIISMFCGVVDDKTIKSRLKECLDNYNLKSHKPYSVGASIGIYVTDYDKTVNFEDLIKASDSLMYMDKVSRKAQRQ
jgi:diguanylate cyclase (GGDEF)-like protein